MAKYHIECPIGQRGDREMSQPNQAIPVIKKISHGGAHTCTATSFGQCGASVPP
jgi:hypothetical protein